MYTDDSVFFCFHLHNCTVDCFLALWGLQLEVIRGWRWRCSFFYIYLLEASALAGLWIPLYCYVGGRVVGVDGALLLSCRFYIETLSECCLTDGFFVYRVVSSAVECYYE